MFLSLIQSSTYIKKIQNADDVWTVYKGSRKIVRFTRNVEWVSQTIVRSPQSSARCHALSLDLPEWPLKQSCVMIFNIFCVKYRLCNGNNIA